jgi:Na+-transporting NADH:ubiquinone oxidoreductase subunit C
MRNFSNTYIFIFSAIMVIVVAALLSFTATILKPYQLKNVEIAKKLDILKSVNLAGDAAEADDKNTYVEGEYDKYIKESFVLDANGNMIEGADAFDINLKVELAKDPEEMELPIFIYSDGSSNKYIFPLRGKGLWGPIWGYVSLDSDFSTIYGATFDHEGETPGLGAEISEQWFQQQFIGKKLFEDNTFKSLTVVKTGASTSYEVDGVSGGTITSKGLEDMIKDGFSNYQDYLQSKMN